MCVHFVCMHVYMSMHACKHMNVCMGMCLCEGVDVHLYYSLIGLMHAYACTCVYVLGVCLCVCMCMSIIVCLPVIHVCVHVWEHAGPGAPNEHMCVCV